MNSKNSSLRNKKIVLILIITFAAFILRLLCCYWGYPLQLHPDEGATVNSTIEMLSRHSWEAHTYDRPDHFEIKCDAILFSIVSWIKYHKPAAEAFEEHKMAFYLLGRFFTAIFGTLLVPLMYAVAGKLTYRFKETEKSIIQVSTACMVAFSAVFVRHSAYAAPDVVLAFFVVLFCYFAVLYLEQGKLSQIIILDVIIGIGVTIKYPAAVLCLPLAILVIYKEYIKNKKFLNVVKYGMLSIGMVLAVIFVLAPNLFTDFNSVYKNFVEEARPNHLGYDGLGFFGNLGFYARTVFEDVGLVTILPFIIGTAYLIRKKERLLLALMPGVVFWVCLSALALHWIRWGIPMYPFYYLVTAIGIGAAYAFFSEMRETGKKAAGIGKAFVLTFAGVITLNVLLSGIAVAKFSLLPDTILVAQDYISEHDISEEESLSEGYTPFYPAKVLSRLSSFTAEGGKVRVADEYADKKYFIMSDSFKGRYLDERERYPEQCEVYEGIDNTYPVVYKIDASGNYNTNQFVILNMIDSVKYLLKSGMVTGRQITIYDMKP